MAHALRQALCRAGSLLSSASQPSLLAPAAAAAAPLEPRALTSLLSFRGFRQQAWAGQSADAAPAEQQWVWGSWGSRRQQAAAGRAAEGRLRQHSMLCA